MSSTDPPSDDVEEGQHPHPDSSDSTASGTARSCRKECRRLRNICIAIVIIVIITIIASVVVLILMKQTKGSSSDDPTARPTLVTFWPNVSTSMQLTTFPFTWTPTTARPPTSTKWVTDPDKPGDILHPDNNVDGTPSTWTCRLTRRGRSREPPNWAFEIETPAHRKQIPDDNVNYSPREIDGQQLNVTDVVIESSKTVYVEAAAGNMTCASRPNPPILPVEGRSCQTTGAPAGARTERCAIASIDSERRCTSYWLKVCQRLETEAAVINCHLSRHFTRYQFGDDVLVVVETGEHVEEGSNFCEIEIEFETSASDRTQRQQSIWNIIRMQLIRQGKSRRRGKSRRPE